MRAYVLAFLAALVATLPARAETPEEWVALGTRVHGGFGAFIPLGIRIGLDAMQQLNAGPRELAVTYFDSKASPCACFADGVALATYTSVGQRNLMIAPEPAPEDAAAVIVVRSRQAGTALRYTVPVSVLARLRMINETRGPRERYDAVMDAEGLFVREPVR